MKIETVPDGYIVDFIDNKHRPDTPEEAVRQNIEKRLVNEHGYSPEQIAVEFTIKVGSSRKKIDLAIFSDNSQRKTKDIQIIIECKNESVKDTNKKEGVGQLQSYMAACINAQWGMWTNGISKFTYKKVEKKDGTWDFDDANDIPSKGRDISEIDRPTRDSLKNATEDNLLYSFKTCHNYIHVNDGLQPEQEFFELLKLIFCKIIDERNIPKPLEFYASSKEKLSIDGRLTVTNRINKIFSKVKTRYSNIFPENDELKLLPISIAQIVSELQKYSLSKTNIDVKGKAYEEVVTKKIRGDRGEFFTPRNVARMAINMLDIPLDATILDPACGSGGFLVIGMNNVIDKLKKDFEKSVGKKEKDWSIDEHKVLMEKVKEIATRNFFGFDIAQALVRAAKMNMVMNNDGEGNIVKNDSLNLPHTWDEEVKSMLCKSFRLKKGSIRRSEDLALFDFVITNPPFGHKLKIDDPDILEQYDLAHIWEKDDSGKLKITDRYSSSKAPEVLFIERCYQFLRPGGIMAIVVPDAILGAPGAEYAGIREWLVQKMKIIASIDLHVDTFQPSTGTQTSVIFLQKKTVKELQLEESRKIEDYKIFFAIIDKIGYDKRAVPIYKRDHDGSEIFFEHKEDGKITKSRELDDQTPEIAKVFLNWKKTEGIRW